MKIYNNNKTPYPPTSTPPILTNMGFISNNMSNKNTVLSKQCNSLGRFKTLGVAFIDPKLSGLCGEKNVKICGGLDVCGDLTVTGTTTLGDLIINGDTIINGTINLCDISACNIDISENLTVGGDTVIEGDTTLVDVSANIISYKNNSQFFNWGVHIIPISNASFRLTLISDITLGIITTQDVIITWPTSEDERGGWIYPGYGGYGVLTDGAFISWSDRGSYPTDGIVNREDDGYAWQIALPIPFDGELTHKFSRFSWMLGRYDAGSLGFTLDISFYLFDCHHEIPIVITPPMARARITRKCGFTTWGRDENGIQWNTFPIPTGDIPISAGQAIGIFIDRNTGEQHSPATFTLEVQRTL